MTSHHRTSKRGLITAAAVLAALGGVPPAAAMLTDECKALHGLIDHGLAGFGQQLGALIFETAAGYQFREYIGSTRPFENCNLFISAPGQPPTFSCDLFKDLPVPTGEQTEDQRSISAQTLASLAGDVAQCLKLAPMIQAQPTAKNRPGTDGIEWAWTGRNRRVNAHAAYSLTLTLRQAVAGQALHKGNRPQLAVILIQHPDRK